MKWVRRVAIANLLAIAGFMGSVCYGLTPTGDLSIIELKMTGSESIVLENTSAGTIDNLSNYVVGYFNKAAPTSLALPTDSQQLPAVSLGAKQSILIAGDSAQVCGAAVVAHESFSMSDSGGYLMVSKVGTEADGSLVFAPQDHVNWTSSSSGADIVSVPSGSSDPSAVWYRDLGSGSWTKTELGSNCSGLYSLIVASSGPTYVDWANGEAAPSTIVSLSSAETGGIPAVDEGLAAPQVTEVLPNPASPQTDGEDEFIELYNPNGSSFDLSGFKLQVGISTKHSYSIPDGTLLPGKSFKAFYSIDTGLNMSNNGGQARLLDPLSQIISQTDAYGTAKDNQAWALADGHWYWTDTPTPGAANAVSQAGISSKPTATRPAGSVKAASSSGSYSPNAGSANSLSLHPLTLAVVGSGALLYAAYEYRYDVANHVGKLRRYIAARRTSGK